MFELMNNMWDAFKVFENSMVDAGILKEEESEEEENDG